MGEPIRGLDREEMRSALRRQGQRVIPVKWDDYSDRYMHTHRQRLEEIFAAWGRDYVQVAPGYRHTPLEAEGEERSVYARQRGEALRGFSPGYSDYLDEWGCRWKTTDADEVGANCIEHPYASLEAALKAKIPAPDPDRRLEPIRRMREEHPGEFLWVQHWLGPWEVCRALLGTEEALVALYSEPARLGRLLGRLFEHFRALIAGICALEVELVGIGDDWGIERTLLIDPAMWVRVFKPLYRPLFEEIRRAGKISLFHCCGAAEPLYPHMIDLGVDILHPLQPGPVDIERVGREYRGEVTFWGGLDTRQLLEKGSPGEVAREVEHVIRALGTADGGLVVGACTSVHSGTPIENIEAMFRAARLYRW